MIPVGMTIKEYYERDGARKKRRKAAAAFNAKMKGEHVQVGRKFLIDQIDHLFSLYIRRRDRRVSAGICLICNRRPIEVCYHLVPRSSYMTRWNDDNAVGACSPCNWAEKNNRLKYRRLHIVLFGAERIERMEVLAGQRAAFSRADLEAIRDEIKTKLEKKS